MCTKISVQLSAVDAWTLTDNERAVLGLGKRSGDKKKGDARGKTEAKARSKALREDMRSMQQFARDEAKAHGSLASQHVTSRSPYLVPACSARFCSNFSAPSSCDLSSSSDSSSESSTDDSSPPPRKAPKMAPKALGKRATHPKPRGKSQ